MNKLLLIIFIFAFIFVGCAGGTYNDSKPIVSLNKGSEINGAFFLGCGSVSGIDYFYCYVKNKDSSFELRKFPTRVSKIYEDAAVDTARVLCSITIGTGNLLTDGGIKNRLYDKSGIYLDAVEFHVPSGTIVREFRAE